MVEFGVDDGGEVSRERDSMIDNDQLHRLMLEFLAGKSESDPREWFAPDRDVYGHCLYEFHYWLKNYPPRSYPPEGEAKP